MMRIATALAVSAILLTAPLHQSSPAAERLDQFGDPLPPGAVARMGTTRLRRGGEPCFHPDGKILVTNGPHFWDVETGKLLRTDDAAGEVRNISFSGDGGRYVGVGRSAAVVADMQTGKRLYVFDDDPKNCSPKLSPDGRFVVVPVGDIRLWRLDDHAAVKVWRRAGDYSCADFSADRQTIVAGESRVLRRLRADTGEIVATFVGHEGKIRDLDISPDDTLVA
jgi:WD40 repeat protein